MTEKTKSPAIAKPHSPRRPGSPEIGLDLEDLTRKAVTYGPWRVLGETILNLCLMANDQFKGDMKGSQMTGTPPKRGK